MMEGSSNTTSIDLENDDDNKQKLIIPEEEGSSNMSNCCLIIAVLIFIGPIIILDAFYFYYSFHGGECGNKKDNFGLTINDYLLGQAISILMMLFIIIIGIFLCTCIYKDIGKNIPYQIIAYTMTAFSVIWLIIGCVVYWAKTDTDNCTTDKNTFIVITIIFSIVVLCASLSFSGRCNRE
jgi:cytochrome bd-type quinol oxidase subunit 2